MLVVDGLQGSSADSRKQMLRLEVIVEDISRARIVKVGPSEELAGELAGCRWRIV